MECSSDDSDDSDNINQHDSEIIPDQQLSTYEPSKSNILFSSKKEWTVRLVDGDVFQIHILALPVPCLLITTDTCTRGSIRALGT